MDVSVSPTTQHIAPSAARNADRVATSAMRVDTNNVKTYSIFREPVVSSKQSDNKNLLNQVVLLLPEILRRVKLFPIHRDLLPDDSLTASRAVSIRSTQQQSPQQPRDKLYTIS